MRDFLEWVLLLAIFLSCLSGGIYGVEYHQRYMCESYQEVTGRKTKWVFMDTCYIKTETDWLTRKEYNSVLVAREGLQSRNEKQQPKH